MVVPQERRTNYHERAPPQGARSEILVISARAGNYHGISPLFTHPYLLILVHKILCCTRSFGADLVLLLSGRHPLSCTVSPTLSIRRIYCSNSVMKVFRTWYDEESTYRLLNVKWLLIRISKVRNNPHHKLMM